MVEETEEALPGPGHRDASDARGASSPPATCLVVIPALCSEGTPNGPRSRRRVIDGIAKVCVRGKVMVQ